MLRFVFTKGATEACTWLYFVDGDSRLRMVLVCPVILRYEGSSGFRNLDSHPQGVYWLSFVRMTETFLPWARGCLPLKCFMYRILSKSWEKSNEIIVQREEVDKRNSFLFQIPLLQVDLMDLQMFAFVFLNLILYKSSHPHRVFDW